jgi:hypothetical protein
MAGNRLLDLHAMLIQKVADAGADEIRAVGIESFLDKQVDLAKVYCGHINGYFFTFRHFLSLPSTWMVFGWYTDYICIPDFVNGDEY